MHLIDLTHTFGDNMPVYPGDPPSELKQIATIETEGYVDHQLQTALHVGTHIDAPLHMLAGGKKISDFGPEKFFGRGVLVDVRGQFPIEPTALQGATLAPGDIVLFSTGLSRQYGQPTYFETYPELTPAAADVLIAAGVSIVGFDTPSPDRPPFATHKLLLKHDVLIIENLTNLEQLIGIPQFTIIALPAKLDAEAAPVRVIAQVV